MPPNLRPRHQLPPSDHNYAKSLTHLPVYSENSWPVILSGPNGIFEKDSLLCPQSEEDKEDQAREAVEEEGMKLDECTLTTVVVKVERKRSWSTTSETGEVQEGNEVVKMEMGGQPPKKRRKKFFKGTTFEPKRRRKRKKPVENFQEQKGESQESNTVPGGDSSLNTNPTDRGSNTTQLDVSTNAEKPSPQGGDMILDDNVILLKPSGDEGVVPGLYNLSSVERSNSDGGTTSEGHPVLSQPPAPPPTASSGKMKRICTSCTNECQWRRKRCSSLPPESDSRRQSERLIKLNYKFPFEDLPDVCKLKIFSYLKPCDKGRAAQVCSEWGRLMRSPGLWAHMNFAAFNPSHTSIKYRPFRGGKVTPMTSSILHGQFPWFSTYVEYEDYKNRVSKFLTYMQDVNPKLKSLTFAYDVGEPKDDWLKWISSFLNQSQCQDLTYADIDWTWTPLRLSYTDRYCCLFNKMQIKYRLHEKRVKHFNRLQIALAKAAPKLAHLKTPFDWSARSVLLMCRMKQLRTLQLGQYMMLRGVQQEMIDTLLRNMPQLRDLEIKVCSPYHNFTTTYSIRHDGLRTLDISACKGFYLRELQCPQLTTLKLGRYPWKGPLVAKETNRLLCMYALCRKGTPRLACLNRHHIQAYWVEFLYDELNSVLCKVCSCKDHLYRQTAAAPVVAEDDDPGGGGGGFPGNQGNNAHAPPPPFVNFVPNAQQALDLLSNVKANIVPLFPLLHQDDDAVAPPQGKSTQKQHSDNFVPGSSNAVIDDAVAGTSYAAIPSTSRGPSIPVSSKGKSCSRFKAKRSRPASQPEVEPSEASDNEELIPIDHPTVEVRSTPRVNTFPFIGTPTHVAVIPIRVVDQRPGAGVVGVGEMMPPSAVAFNSLPLAAIQSIAMQPQLIGVDKRTGTHVLSGPLTVIKHLIQVVPPESPPDNAAPAIVSTIDGINTSTITPRTISAMADFNMSTITPVTLSALPNMQANLQTVELDMGTAGPGGDMDGHGFIQSPIGGMLPASETGVRDPPTVSTMTSSALVNLRPLDLSPNPARGVLAATGGFTCNGDADLVTVSMEDTERVVGEDAVQDAVDPGTTECEDSSQSAQLREGESIETTDSESTAHTGDLHEEQSDENKMDGEPVGEKKCVE